MDKTILVVGDVTRDQYQPIRLDFLRQGHRPKIVRVTPAEFFVDAEDLVERYYPERLLALDLSLEEYESCIRRHIESFGPPAALIIDSQTRYLSNLDSLGKIDVGLRGYDIDLWYIEGGQAQYAGSTLH